MEYSEIPSKQIAMTDPSGAGDDPEKYRTGFRRFFALIIDSLVISVIAAPFAFIFRLLAESQPALDVEFVIGTAYLVALTAKYGKTPGKHLCKVKVVSYPGEGRIGWKESVMREIVPVILVLMMLPMGFLWGMTRGPNPFGITWAILLLVGGFGWSILEVVTFLLDPKRRALHDKLAGTVVVRTGNFAFLEAHRRERTSDSPT